MSEEFPRAFICARTAHGTVRFTDVYSNFTLGGIEPSGAPYELLKLLGFDEQAKLLGYLMTLEFYQIEDLANRVSQIQAILSAPEEKE